MVTYSAVARVSRSASTGPPGSTLGSNADHGHPPLNSAPLGIDRLVDTDVFSMWYRQRGRWQEFRNLTEAHPLAMSFAGVAEALAPTYLRKGHRAWDDAANPRCDRSIRHHPVWGGSYRISDFSATVLVAVPSCGLRGVTQGRGPRRVRPWRRAGRGGGRGRRRRSSGGP